MRKVALTFVTPSPPLSAIHAAADALPAGMRVERAKWARVLREAGRVAA